MKPRSPDALLASWLKQGVDAQGAGPGEVRADWDAIRRAALERDLLDGVDMALIRTLAKQAGRPGDAAFLIVLACLLAAVKSGALRIPAAPEALAERLERFLRSLYLAPAADSEEVKALGFAEAARRMDPAGQALETAREFEAARIAGAYAQVMGEPPGFMPLLRSGGGLYFQKYFAAEASAGLRLAELLGAPDRLAPASVPDSAPESAPDSRGGPDTGPGGRIDNLLDTVLHKFPLRLPASGGSGLPPPMSFDARQKAALEASLKKRLLVVSGGPGTGKTSLAANILRLAARAGTKPARMRLAAPTGRAAQRLSESLRRSLESIAFSPADAGEAALDGALAALECETLHRLLRYNPSTGEYFHRRERPLPADLLVIDEVSMVDIFTLSRLLDSLAEGASLILLGDMDQLPSVEAGAVLADLVAPGTGAMDASPPPAAASMLGDHLVVLGESHRSQAAILETTRRINAQDGPGALAAMAGPRVPDSAADSRTGCKPDSAIWPVVFLQDGRKVCPGGGCRLLPPQGGESDPAREWDSWLDSWIGFHYLGNAADPASHPGRTLAHPRKAAYADLIRSLGAGEPPRDEAFPTGLAWRTSPPEGEAGRTAEWIAGLAELFAYLDQARILTFTRKGWHGSESINRKLGKKLRPEWDPGHEVSESGGFHGAPIMILENDHAKGLFNGDVGVQLRVRGRSLVLFQRPGAYVAHPAHFLPRHECAFAMTVHKSQGSEYDQVLLVLPEAGNRLLYKETLYTALTRARYFAGVFGPAEVFLEAVANKVVRESGLPDYLKAVQRL